MIRENHREIFEKLGIKTDGRLYEDCVEDLVALYLVAAKEINNSNKDFFRREIYKLNTDRRN